MIIAQLNALKDKSGLNIKQISERADLPYSTVQKIFSGDTQSPNIDYVFRIVTAMGYTLNDLYPALGTSGKEEATVAVIREMYENRIADIKEQHLMHIAEVKDRIGTYKIAVTVLSIATAVLFILFFTYFMIDYSTEHWGIFFNVRR